jgi:hypothetical protein
MTQKHRYCDDDKANALAALAANGGNIARTARDLGVPRQTLQKWANGRVPDVVLQKGQEKKRSLADKLEEVAHRLLGGVEGKIDGAKLGELFTSIGIAVDKLMLLRNELTGINEQRQADAAAIAQLIAQLDRGDD